MSNLLQTLITFVGVMLLLALAAQSVQEILKTIFTLKGNAQLKAIEGLIREAVRQKSQTSIDADKIYEGLIQRLRALGQKGWRKNKVRLDEIGADSLRDLIKDLPVAAVPGLGAVAQTEAKDALEKVAQQVHQWFDLAMRPVDGRYRRRMRVVALGASAIVVISLNAGADRMFYLSRTDPDFRALVDSMVTAVRAIPADSVVPDTANLTVLRGAEDTAAAADTLAPAGRSARADVARRMLYADQSNFFALPSWGDLGTPSWWPGILLSVLLVSLGAPFWHDLLESLFGLKNRIRAEAQRVKEEVRDTDRRAPLNQPT